jgi:hypothetical protein
MNARGLEKRMRRIEARAEAKVPVYVWADAGDEPEMIQTKAADAAAAHGLTVDQVAVTVFRWADAPGRDGPDEIAFQTRTGIYAPRGTTT